MSAPAVTLTVREPLNYPEKKYFFVDATQCVVGRAPDCDIRVPPDHMHVDVSRHHCVLDIDPPVIRIRDLGSRNGTYVNGVQIGHRPAEQAAEEVNPDLFDEKRLRDGDEVRLGPTLIQVNVDV